MAPAKAPQEVELPAPLPTDVPAGGLDVPPAAKRPSEDREEAFPGEFQLSAEERNRWLILHFALPRTIMTYDVAAGRSTEAELNDALAGMSWGSVDPETSEWTLESEEPSLDCPFGSLISYVEYMERTFPSDRTVDEDTRIENAKMAAAKREVFTAHGEPGVRFRPTFDQIVKNLAHSNKALMKAYDLKKPVLCEDDVPEDPGRSDAQNCMRFARHQVLPAFWQLLINLTKKGRRFSVVFRTFSEEQVTTVQKELQLFCQGQHPAYDGKNKTQKPPPMNGEKGSRDMRLLEACIGKLDRFAGCLEFANRPAGDSAKTAKPGEQATAAAATTPPPAEENSSSAEGEEVVAEPAPPPATKPTVYEFEPFHEMYAGLQCQVLDGANTCAIVDDLEYWQSKDKDSAAGKLMLVDHGQGLAETKIQHIFFDGNIGGDSAHCVDVRDVVSGKPLGHKESAGLFTHRVNFFEAATDPEYFVKAVEACELNFSKKILEVRKVAGDTAAGEEANRVADMPPKEYLYNNIIPALLPALEACQRDRPADPIEFIAFYMLRHSKQYSKTLKA